MPGSVALRLAEAGEYRHSVRDLFSQFVVTGGATFSALLTRTKLLRFELVQSRETAARVALVTLPPELMFFSFSSLPGCPLLWRGIALEFGDIMMHGRGELLHQRITGASSWGMISLPAASFGAFSKALTGTMIPMPHTSQLLRPAAQISAGLLRVHAAIGHVAGTKPNLVRDPEAVRAMEHELAEALIASVSGAEVRTIPASAFRAQEIMLGFERLLAQPFGFRRSAPELAAELGISDRTLRNHCSATLGASPLQYVQLRQLELARSALLQADPATARIGEIATESGFTQLGRFATRYRAVFGETPSATLLRTQRLR